MLENRHRLRVFYLALCAAQLIIMGVGLGLAYQIQRSYSRNIDYESSVNNAHRALDELQVLARVASSGTVAPTDDTVLSQVSQTEYASKIFVRKTQELLDKSKQPASSPLARSGSDLQELITQMSMVSGQMGLAQEAFGQRDMLLVQARFTYADRAAARVQSILGTINQDMAHTKDELLLKESAEARGAQFILRPLAILGILFVLPALLYARAD